MEGAFNIAVHYELTSEAVPAPVADLPAALLYGYGVYSTFVWPLSQRWLAAHWARLENNALMVGMGVDCSPDFLRAKIEACFRPEMPVIRITVVPDISNVTGLFAPVPLKARLFMSFRPLPPEMGALRLRSVPYQRAMATIKHVAMADILLQKREAVQAGFDDILLTAGGPADPCVCEAATANVFFIREGTLLSPLPERDGCLPGITRLQVLEAASRQGLPVSMDAPVPLSSIPEMDAAFLTNAVQGMVRVSSVDDIHFSWPPEAEALFSGIQTALHRVQAS